MNFFANQAKAKSNTTKLVLLLSLAVATLIAITQLLVITVFCWSQGIAVFDIDSFRHAFDLLGADLFWSIALVIAAIVLLASLYKSAQLAGGGHIVAESLDGILINANTTNADEKKILNVVEEMAIASGTSVPPVYVIEDNAINAFAAGYTAKDAVIGITRGCIQTLSRDELQGVIAHEFSHIFNGDMRLNIRLISILHGILFIGMIGHFMLRMTPNRSSRSSRDSKGVALFAALGIGLYIIGYAGTFFGNLIKAAVSRQREFLADASAVQFTRNPSGIADALKKIGGYVYGSRLGNPASDEISHLLFNQGIGNTFSSLMATHPVLEERIKRIEPRWNGEFIKTGLPYSNPFMPQTTSRAKKQYANVNGGLAMGIADSSLTSVGRPTPAHIEEAKTILLSIPEPLMDAAHDSYSARALVYCLLLDIRRAHILEQQLIALKNEANPETYKNVMALKDIVATLPVRFRLPLIDICIPTLKQLRPVQYQLFKKKMLLLIQADNKVDLFEWSLFRIVVRHLENTQHQASNKRNSLNSLQADCQRLISAVALKNAKSITEAERFFADGWNITGLPVATLVPNALEDLNALNTALKKAGTLHPLKKPQLIKACCATLKDNTQAESVELIRAIADGLDVPMPPLLSGQTLC
jgi:Zn-dependent protease with chaperone function